MRLIIIPLGILLLLLTGNSIQAQVMEEDEFFTSALRQFLDKDDAANPSVRIVQEYDDNIGLEPGYLKEGSWKTFLAPTILLDFPGKQTRLFLEYTPTFIFYYRRDDELDINHDAVVKFSHYFTPRYWVHLNDIFLRKEDPQDIRRPVIPQERDADYNFNLAEFIFGNQLTKKIIWGIEYNNERFDYDKSVMRKYFNRTSNVGEATFRYELNPALRLNGSYRYRNTDYDQSDSDYYSHLLRGGCHYQIAKRLTAQVWGGYQSRHYDTGQTLTGPYLEINFEIIVRNNLYFEVAYWHKIEDTYEITHRGSLENGLKGTAHYRLFPKIKLVLDYLGIFSHYPSSLEVEGETTSANETFWRLNAAVDFEVLEDTLIKLGFRHTENSSDFPDASYYRNQIYIEFTQSF
jgi:hypothetical protein